jgi:PAS domain S-box-containing protein
VNPAGCRLLGGRQEDILGKNWFDTFVPERLRDGGKKKFAGILSGQTGPADPSETPVLTLSGSERLVSWHTSVIRDENRMITGILSSGEDITDRRRMEQDLEQKHEELMASYEQLTATEEELKSQFDELSRIQKDLVQSEARLRLTLEATNDGIWDWNIPTGVAFFSSHWYTMLGYEPGEFPATYATWRSLIHPDDLSAAEQKIQDHIRKNDPGYAIEFRMRTKQGDWNWILSRGKVVERDGQDKPLRMVGTHTDITPRKRIETELAAKHAELLSSYEHLAAAEEELKSQFEALVESERIIRSSEERLVMAQEISQTGCWEYSVATEKIWGSAEAFRIFGYPAHSGEFPLNMIEVCIPDRDRVHQALLSLVLDGKEYDLEYTIHPADGSPARVVHSRARLSTDIQGRPTRVMGVIQDISERKLAETSLQRINQKLSVISQLTWKDLTNQLFVLRSYLEVARKHAVGQEQILEDLGKCQRAIVSVNEIIDFTKDYHDLGSKPPKWQNVKTSLLFGLSHISTGTIQHSLETGDLEIFADPQLEKAFQGMFENSVTHGVHVTRIRISHTITPQGISIIYEDDGLGIPASKKESIFLRSEGGLARVRGLFFVREILDITGMTIRETGEPGKGVRFEIQVPSGIYRFNPGSGEKKGDRP